MSGQVITQLFQQIFDSEEKIKQRFEDLKRVNQNIQQHQEKIKTTNYERDAMLGKLNILRHQYIEAKVELKWLETRRDILVKQKEECLSAKRKLEEELKEVDNRQSEDRSKFEKECQQFLGEFGILNDDWMIKREMEMKKSLEGLLIENENMLKDLEGLENKKQKRDDLQKQKETILMNKEMKKKEKEDLMKTSKKLTAELRHLRKTKERISTQKSTDSSLQSLLKKLEHSKQEFNTLSRRNNELQNNLHHLQTPQNSSISTENKSVRPNPWHINKKVTGLTTVEASFAKHSSAGALHLTKRFQYQPVNKRKRDSAQQQRFNNKTCNTKQTYDLSGPNTREEDVNSFDFNVVFQDNDETSLVDISLDLLEDDLFKLEY